MSGAGRTARGTGGEGGSACGAAGTCAPGAPRAAGSEGRVPFAARPACSAAPRHGAARSPSLAGPGTASHAASGQIRSPRRRTPCAERRCSASPSGSGGAGLSPQRGRWGAAGGDALPGVPPGRSERGGSRARSCAQLLPSGLAGAWVGAEQAARRMLSFLSEERSESQSGSRADGAVCDPRVSWCFSWALEIEQFRSSGCVRA